MKNFAIASICISVYLCQPIIAAASESSSNMPHPIDLNPAYLRNAEVFAASFGDPNMVIGVFESSFRSPYTGQAVGEIIGGLDESFEAIVRFLLEGLFPLEIIQGELNQPVIFVPITVLISTAPPGSLEYGSPGFYPPSGTKWLLALRKTTPEYRKARFGEEINKYQWLNDDTLFALTGYGFGQFCIQWTEAIDMPDRVVKVPENIIDDFRVIQKIATDLQESRLDPSDAADMAEMLEIEQAKSIYAELLRIKTADPQDSVDESSESEREMQ